MIRSPGRSSSCARRSPPPGISSSSSSAWRTAVNADRALVALSRILLTGKPLSLGCVSDEHARQTKLSPRPLAELQHHRVVHARGGNDELVHTAQDAVRARSGPAPVKRIAGQPGRNGPLHSTPLSVCACQKYFAPFEAPPRTVAVPPGEMRHHPFFAQLSPSGQFCQE